MDLQLSGKGAVVTGGSKGVGLAVVRTLLDEGMRVVAASRTVTPELAATGAIPVMVDLGTASGAAQLVEAALAALGGIDVLVNNVGIGDRAPHVDGALLQLAALPDTAWEQTFALTFYAPLRVTRAALPSLVERGGVVVNVSSAGARAVTAGPVPYNVAKAALNALTKVVAEQYGPSGVRAVTVSPGPIATEVWTDPDGFIGRLAQAQGLAFEEFATQARTALGAATGRISTPEEVARLVAVAASPSNVTGAEFAIDGGIVKHV
ncbi:SDR family oxidoreductase [Dactylosporangium vinaceum]|uniref:SDR family oxidoreductase n=1 Tax=Dactylosporangium vinaceum TaxID=53362 RepID=A0ABV5MEH7_9ACTN|nr:SDR family oxidoreductase [Dactylosporangium vinaceum]UAB92397.1 SDR family oxidoreductase [Dactylosporangium vinaceum]